MRRRRWTPAPARSGSCSGPDSPRFIDPYRARAIRSRLPPFVTAVGVFVNQPLEHVTGVASLVRLGAVQLHGDETPRVRGEDIDAGHQGGAGRPPAYRERVAAWPAATTLLLDVHDPVAARRHRPHHRLERGRGGRGRAEDSPGRRLDAGERGGRGRAGAAVRHRRLVGRGTRARRQGSPAPAGAVRGTAWQSRRDPDSRGYFGEFGGRYVPETLVEPVEELERAYFAARDDPELRAPKSIACSSTTSAGRRPSPKRGACRRRPAARAFS